MATTIDTINGAIISPVVTSGTGNDVRNVRAFRKLRALADTNSPEFHASLYDDEDNNNGFSSGELLSLNSQALDILNGVTPAAPRTVPVAQVAKSGYSSLTQLQRENLSSIIRQFADAPFDQNTFQQIQSSLSAARINPRQISLQSILQEVFSGAEPAEAA